MKVTKVTEDKNFIGHAAIFIAQMIFGANMVIGKKAMASPYVTADMLTFYRMIGAAALFWIASVFVPREKVSRKDLGRLFLASLFGIMLNQYTFIHGLSLTSPINASMISLFTPMITMLLAALLLKEPITLKKAGGVAAAICGGVILVFCGLSANSGSDIRGDLLCVVSCTSFALYLTLFRDLIRRYRAITLMKWMFLYATICSLPFSYESLSPGIWSSMPSDILIEVLYVILFATFLSYLLIPVGQKHLRPTVVSTYNSVQPLVASIVSVSIGMTAFGLYQAAAAALIFCGLYLTSISKSRAQVEASS